MNCIYLGSKDINFTSEDGKHIIGKSICLAFDHSNGFYNSLKTFFVDSTKLNFISVLNHKVGDVVSAEFEINFQNDKIRLKSLK